MTRPARGFTLLEILVALMLLGVLLTVVTSTLVLAQRGLNGADRYLQRLGEVRAAQNFLHQAIQQTLPIQRMPQGLGQVFVGEPDSLRFAAALPSDLGGGIHWHILDVAGDGKRQALRIRFETSASTPWGEPQWLLREVRAVRLSYRGVDTLGKRTAWLDSWPWPRRLPRQVRIAVQAEGPVPWTTQVIALRLDLSGELAAP
ncbi:hypothetical protein PS627_04295 [Pseudomonas fluorescens]|uniref:prepilin-type N-terminal cleavage/methylation domain-containing protein n=1 Tax=Pseudomonas fluorescens TaxID=294 RepID=UPI001250D7C8|nr:prepilin-type N-terminal cleavage/methylation domain-containing protein [Pseudomonas fluorescens]CAG8871115.1 hypothetical protein PS627_04295 [Pseudomonas fluorescens]VVP93606.1 hypothetical protein PS910_03121 [Pseudomonas fluorescens]